MKTTTTLFTCARLMVTCILLVACAAPAPTIEPTVMPTITPLALTNTPVPPTATFTPIPPTKTSVPTATLVPPTDTPAPTNTPVVKPTQAVTTTPRITTVPKPTVTKGTSPSSEVSVSSKPSTLQKSAQQSLDTILAMTGILNQMLSGGAELCAPLQEKYQSIHNAPQYDVSGQPSQIQQAYALYRQAIDLVDTRALTIQECGKGGGPIGRNDQGILHGLFAQAASLFGQAVDWTKRAGTVSADMPFKDAVARVQLAVSQIGLAFQRVSVGRVERCEPFVDEYNIIANAPTYDVSAQSANIQTAYSLYRNAIETVLPRITPVAEMCNKGGGVLNKLDFFTAQRPLKEAESYLTQALNLLGQ